MSMNASSEAYIIKQCSHRFRIELLVDNIF